MKNNYEILCIKALKEDIIRFIIVHEEDSRKDNEIQAYRSRRKTIPKSSVEDITRTSKYEKNQIKIKKEERKRKEKNK